MKDDIFGVVLTKEQYETLMSGGDKNLIEKNKELEAENKELKRKLALFTDPIKQNPRANFSVYDNTTHNYKVVNLADYMFKTESPHVECEIVDDYDIRANERICTFNINLVGIIRNK